jgi:hypothetical protein
MIDKNTGAILAKFVYVWTFDVEHNTASEAIGG